MASVTAEVLGSGVVGAAVGWGLSFISSERSFRKARRQAEDTRRAQSEAERRGALLALAWELKADQMLLERAKAGKWRPPLLPHVALDAALAWYWSLLD